MSLPDPNSAEQSKAHSPGSGAHGEAGASTGATQATGAPEPQTPPASPAQVARSRSDRMTGWHSRDIVRAAALGLGLYVLLKLLWFANTLVLVAFLGVLFGLAVESGVDRLEKLHIRRGIGAAIIVLGFFGLLTGFGFSITPTIRQQSRELREKIPEAAERIQNWINKRQNGLLGLVLGRGGATGVPGAESTAAVAMDSAAPSSRQDTSAARPPVAGATTRVVGGGAGASTSAESDVGAPSATETLRSRIGRQLSGATRYLFPFLSQTVAAFAGLMLIIFMSIYIAAEPELYRRGLMHMFPHRTRDRAGEVLSAVAAVLRRWLVTQLIAMLVIGTVTTVALLILDVDAAFALGLIAGLLEFVPNIGPILSAIPAVAMAFLDSPEKALVVAGVYVGIQFLENHLLIPLLMKDGVGVPPVLTILAQALLVLLFGFLGLLVAVPLLAAVMVVVKMLYVEGVVGDEMAIVNAQGTASAEASDG